MRWEDKNLEYFIRWKSTTNKAHLTNLAFAHWNQASLFNFEQKGRKYFLILWCFRETSRQFQEDRQVVSTDHPIPILENNAIWLIFLQLHSREHISKVSSPGKLWASSTAQIFVGEDYTPGQPAAAECCKHKKKPHVEIHKNCCQTNNLCSSGVFQLFQRQRTNHWNHLESFILLNNLLKDRFSQNINRLFNIKSNQKKKRTYLKLTRTNVLES